MLNKFIKNWLHIRVDVPSILSDKDIWRDLIIDEILILNWERKVLSSNRLHLLLVSLGILIDTVVDDEEFILVYLLRKQLLILKYVLLLLF